MKKLFFALVVFLSVVSCKPSKILPDSRIWDLKMKASFSYLGETYTAEGESRLCVYHAGTLQDMSPHRWNEDWSGSGAYVNVPELGNVIFLWPDSQSRMILRRSVESDQSYNSSRDRLFNFLSDGKRKVINSQQQDFRVVLIKSEGDGEYFDSFVDFVETKNLSKAGVDFLVNVEPAQGEMSYASQVVEEAWYQDWKSARLKKLSQYQQWWLDETYQGPRPPQELTYPINQLRDSDFSRNLTKVFGTSKAASKLNKMCQVKL